MTARDAEDAAYREVPPGPALRDAVECFWTRTTAGSSTRILPDGCMDILFRGDARGFSGSVVGTMTRALVTDAAPGVFVGVRFLPGEARRFLRFDAREAQDRVVRLDDVWGALGRTLAARIAEAETQRARVAILESALVAQRAHALPADRRVRRAVAALGTEGARVASVAADQSLSPRQLHRLFEEHVGAGPKVVARILRLQRALARREPARASWAEVAAAAGYADQAHLVRECRDLAGVAPGDLAPRWSAPRPIRSSP